MKYKKILNDWTVAINENKAEKKLCFIPQHVMA